MRLISASRIASTTLFLTLSTVAGAASITNTDSVAVILSVTESGNRQEVAIDAGATQELCATGCFVTFPNGDRLALDGHEKMKIVKGAATSR